MTRRRAPPRRSCSVVNEHCEVPANMEPADMPTRMPSCALCKHDVCRSCSSIRTVDGRKVRACDFCQEDLLGTPLLVEARELSKSGYPKMAAKKRKEHFALVRAFRVTAERRGAFLAMSGER